MLMSLMSLTATPGRIMGGGLTVLFVLNVAATGVRSYGEAVHDDEHNRRLLHMCTHSREFVETLGHHGHICEDVIRDASVSAGWRAVEMTYRRVSVCGPVPCEALVASVAANAWGLAPVLLVGAGVLYVLWNLADGAASASAARRQQQQQHLLRWRGCYYDDDDSSSSNCGGGGGALGAMGALVMRLHDRLAPGGGKAAEAGADADAVEAAVVHHHGKRALPERRRPMQLRGGGGENNNNKGWQSW